MGNFDGSIGNTLISATGDLDGTQKVYGIFKVQEAL